jgi:hypothetical protein
LVASYTRSAFDLNLGAAASTMLSGAWNWRRPRNNWGLNASYSRIQSSRAALSNVSGWQATGGYMQRLPANLLVTINYTHVNSRGAYLNLANSITVDGARITVGWAPHRGRRGLPGAADIPDDQ